MTTTDRRSFSDKYFLRAEHILEADGHDPVVLMQFFCRTNAVLCGMEESLELINACEADLEVCALAEGDSIEPWETVLTVRGPYRQFAHLETLLLGVLARGTRVATQTRAIVDAAGGKSVLFFGARHDHYLTQSTDGHAALVGGASGVATDQQGVRDGVLGLGTMPHALVAAYNGDTVVAAEKFVEHMPDVPFIALVDFANDCVGTSLATARALGDRLQGVRLDTSASLIDIALEGVEPPQYGVTPMLVDAVRVALDREGFQHVEIVVSGGLTGERVGLFESSGAAVDAYGVGSAVLRNFGEFDFTADIVEVDGQPVSKVGRSFKPNPRLVRSD